MEATSSSSSTSRLIPLRDARDRIIQILGIGVPYPLRDLPLEYPEMVAKEQPIKTNIVGAQTGVRYQLRDAEGNELPSPTYQVVPTGVEGDAGVVLNGPNIEEDVAYTIMAVRDVASVTPSVLLETYLNQTMEVMVGIDRNLDAFFAPQGNQVTHDEVTHDDQLVADYGDPNIAVTINNSQEGITYQLFQETWDSNNNVWKEGPSLSEPPVNGLGLTTPISLHLKFGTVLQEDTGIKIRANRGNGQFADLVVRLTVQVRPNPAVVVQADPLILDHNTAPKLALTEFQPSATYTLYSRPLASVDYHATWVEGDLKIANGEGDEIFVQSPVKITNWDDPTGFVKLGDFVAASGPSPLIPLLTDTLFIVRATKTDNRDNRETTLQLNQAVVVLVRPRSDPKMATQDSLIAQGAAGTVQLSNTQRGVRYQLLKGGKTPVGAPGYHWEDRGVETMRIEVDFVVEQNEPQDAGGVLWLPTGALTKKTTFSVMATKVITGVPKPLDGTVAIDIKPP